MDETLKYPVAEIFKSLQGEGFNTGREMVFLRTGGCNLSCPWCDTRCGEYTMMRACEIAQRVDAFGIRSMLVTGGEPLIVGGLKSLMLSFKNRGYWIAVETNGLHVADEGVLELFDYVAVSPKVGYAGLYRDALSVTQADEVRVVVEDNAFDFCRFVSETIRADFYFLSPCERGGTMNIEQTIRLLDQLNRSGGVRWLMSVQSHKLCGIR